MASTMIGRATCPECDFKAAHVKKSEKCVYRYCPECGSQHHARTPRQVDDLMKKTRLVEPTATPTPSPTLETPASKPEPNATATPSATPTQGSATPTAKRSALFGL